MKDAQSKWNADQTVLVCTEEFDWPSPHTRTNTFTKCDPAASSKPYWCAIGGQCFALEPSQDSSTCIASVMTALRNSGMPRNDDGWISDDVYVIWQPKDPSPSVWQRWQKKWSKRTALRTAA